MGRLLVRDGRLVLEDISGIRSVSAVDIFRAAVRGSNTVDGVELEQPAHLSAPGILFRAEPAPVGLMVGKETDLVLGRPAFRHRGSWIPMTQIGEDDHVLVDADWYPLEPESYAALQTWLGGDEAKLIEADGYIELYREPGPGFDVIDRLDDQTVITLAGGSREVGRVRGTLYPYQATGLFWLSARSRARLGGILADEMGLGKTLQVIALLAQEGAEARRPNLVVVPLTLVENWVREFAKFAPEVVVYRHVGRSRTMRPSEIGRHEVVITTYETAVSDEAVLGLVDWNLVVVDEAQAIKNPAALRTRAIRALPRRAAFAVTGTPLENRTQDIWSLSEFATPGYLGTREQFAEHLEGDPPRLRLAVRPLLLRREVADVAKDLPEKIEVDAALEMFGPEGARYQDLIGSVRREVDRAPIISLITRLRVFTAHPDVGFGLIPHPESRSAKLARLLELLEEIAATGEKTLVFVAFTEAADIIERSVRRRLGLPVWALDGRTNVRERQSLIDRFSAESGATVLILNPVAGGVGLNIQAASHVIHYTLEWNPAREAQATARAWRRGQQLPVTVHRLFYAGTIDEFMLGKLESKRELFDAVVTPSDQESLLKELLLETLGATPSIAEDVEGTNVD
jgi:SNF2 family DNA or RNA helicase